MAGWLATRPFSFSFSREARHATSHSCRGTCRRHRRRVRVLVRPPFTDTPSSVLERGAGRRDRRIDPAGSLESARSPAGDPATYGNRAAQPRWVADGEANWVTATIVPGGQVIDKDWPLYVYAPKTVFSDRWYDAIGVFGHLSDITGASVVWSRLAKSKGD
jgi:hypothetical protein